MGLFDVFKKKDCEICGKEVGMFGYKKLEDGEICKDCVKLLSPWFDDRRHSTVEQIKAQLAYREENRRELASFRPSKTFGERSRIYVEYQNGVPSRFAVTRYDDLMEENADLISFKNVLSFSTDIREDRDEIKRQNANGEMVSYKPPRYNYQYDFHVEIQVDHPYFSEISIRLNDNTIELESEADMRRSTGGIGQFLYAGKFDPSYNPMYREFAMMCQELEEIFQQGRNGVPQEAPVAPQEAPVAPQFAPAGPKFCPNCGAAADGGKFCQHCGTKF